MPDIDPQRLLGDLYALRKIGAYKTGVHRPTLSPEDVVSRQWLADRMTQLGEAGCLRLEKKLGQVSAGLERQRDEFVATLSKRLGEVEADFRGRLAALADEERALEERLTELTRRIDQTVSRAEQRLDALQGLPR